MQLDKSIFDYIDNNFDEAVKLLKELAVIPAPSHNEYKRVEFCKNWLEAQGAKGVYVDEALNVIFPIGCTDDNDITVYMAHSDVVFPDTDPLPLKIDGNIANCPGIGDDTANVVVILMAAKYIIENGLDSKDGGVLLVINSCEEGLGNLKGSRKIVEDFGSRIKEFITFDGYANTIATTSVGSKRYEVLIETEGGHSYGAFGNRNAIAYMASLINDLYNIKVPEKGKTTYNVGLISGGTSVNTIAQNAQMLFEFRSDVRESMDVMEKHFNAAINFYRTKGIKITVTLVGDRPCMGEVDKERHMELANRAAKCIKNHFGIDPTFSSSSTDCNVPLSVGIPAICPGCIYGGKAHTREEYIELDSLLPGIKFGFEMILYHF